MKRMTTTDLLRRWVAPIYKAIGGTRIGKTKLYGAISYFFVSPKLRRAMASVLREAQSRGVELSSLTALEVFGGTGALHTKYYAPRVADLEVWEINPNYESSLRRNLPRARVKITDSFEEIKRTNHKFNLVVVDNTGGLSNHCEHFDLFPHIFRVCANSALLIINVIPEVTTDVLNAVPEIRNQFHQTHRRSFYHTDDPDHIPVEHMVAVYAGKAEECGFSVDWYLFQKRTFVYYLALKVRKNDK